MRAALVLAALIATPAAAQITGVPKPFPPIQNGFASSPFGPSPALSDPTAGATPGIVGGGTSRPHADPAAAGARCGDGSFGTRAADGRYSCAGRGDAIATTPRR
jgi:hypothetical protein